MKPITIVITTSIRRPRGEIFEYLTNFSNHKDISSANLESRQTSEGPVAVGATMRNLAKFMIFKMEEHFVVTEFVPGYKIAKKSISGSTHVTTDSFELRDLPDGSTEVKCTVYAELTGFYDLFSGLVEKKITTILLHDWINTKARLEQPDWRP